MTLLARVVFVLLVGASFAAFFVAQRLKGAPAVVRVGKLTQHFSPNGDGRRDANEISVRVAEADDVTLSVVDADGDEVRRLLSGRPARAYRPLRTIWDGRTDAGPVAPDGTYRLRIRLRRQNRSVDWQQAIRLDTTPPRPVVRAVEPSVVAPGGEELTLRVRHVSRREPTEFRVLRTDRRRSVEVARFRRAPGRTRVRWPERGGRLPLGAGTYLVTAAVQDRAGNVGTAPPVLPPQPGAIPGRPGFTVRALAIQPPLGPVRVGRRARFFVDARGRDFSWSVRRVGQGRILARGRASSRRPLTVRAPRGPSGAHLLQVQAGDDAARVPFLVQANARAPVLVVVPAITWLGTDRVDDDRDGLPDTLARGGPVRRPRVLVGGADGLPSGFADEVAPLLAFMDRARLRYDVTTDLALADSRDPRPTDRAGVLLPGAVRWVPRDLARRLRRYVADGGRLATFGTESLRRGVTLAPDRLLRPTQPSALDPFGARLGPVKRAVAPLVPLADDPRLGLLTGIAGEIGGFGLREESVPPERSGARVRVALGVEPAAPPPGSGSEEEGAAAAGERHALTATQLGRGVVIRVGLPEWQRRLEVPEVAQVTRNIVDVLRGVRPQIRSRG